MEDKFFGGLRIAIDLTPGNLWGKEIIKQVGAPEWKKVSSHVASRVGGACEFCGASPAQAGVMGKKAHKFKIEMRFAHNEISGMATLRRLLHVCSGCSQAIHLRQAQLMSEGMDPDHNPFVGAVARLATLRGESEETVLGELDKALACWGRREDSGYPRSINFDILDDWEKSLWRAG